MILLLNLGDLIFFILIRDYVIGTVSHVFVTTHPKLKLKLLLRLYMKYIGLLIMTI